jgi:hypothetical protein
MPTQDEIKRAAAAFQAELDASSEGIAAALARMDAEDAEEYAREQAELAEYARRANLPVAADIYERMDNPGMGGSVHNDIRDMSMADMEDYFGDTDPAEWL